MAITTVHKRTWLITLIFVLVFFVEPHRVYSYDLEKRVLSHTLKNGLKILMVERHLSPTVSLYIRHRVGAVDEDSGRTGSAHLLEHMMFKGTETIGTKNFQKEKNILKLIAKTGRDLDLEMMKGERADKDRIDALKSRLESLQEKHKKLFTENEIDRLYTENGADNLNASTGQDITTYHVSIPSNKIELWARIEADRMTNPVFREFYAERKVVTEERKQRIELDPEGSLFEHFYASAFIAHPYRRPILGWYSDISLLDPQYLKAFLKRYYAPNNTVIAVVGDINPSKTLKIIKRYFGPIPHHAMDPLPITKEPPQRGERRVNVESEANPQLLIGYHKPTMPCFDDYVFDVIDSILSEGRTSRFYRSIIEKKGVAERIRSINGLPGSRYPNLFVITAKPRHPHSIGDLEAAIYEEIEKLKTTPVLDRELIKIKNQLKASFIRNLNSNSGLANLISYFEILLGDYRYITNHINVIEKVSPEDIMRVAQKYLISENRTVTSLIPRNKQGTIP